MRRKSEKGLTLIELIVVIVIIGIVSILIYQGADSSIMRARDAERKRELNTMKQLLAIYREQNGTYCILPSGCNPSSTFHFDDSLYGANGSLKDTFVPKYINEIPKDPKFGGIDKDYSLFVKGSSFFQLSAQLENLNDPEKVTSCPENVRSTHNYCITND